jgi:DNA mismatch repair protein MutL
VAGELGEIQDPSHETEGIIRLMPEVLANKIAAGEVVQRPAAVVKELLENALDAGASDVKVSLRAAGADLIRVLDNGAGMNEVDARLSVARHATSKIRTIEDLESIRTLGFRGEALASIASVSDFEMRTRRVGDEHGFLLRLQAGKIVAEEPAASPEGTGVTVQRLFFNTPARRRFLKTPATELRHCVETVQAVALANPALRVYLEHDGNVLMECLPCRGTWQDALRERTIQVFGEVADRAVPVDESTSYLTLRGLVGDADSVRRSRGEQYIFVNNRPIRSRYLEHAVRSAYEGLLPDRSFPFHVLFLEVDPRHVDVNVHPAKAEVKFDDESGVYGFVRAVVKRTLGMAGLTPQLDLAMGGAPTPIDLNRMTQQDGRLGVSRESAETERHAVPRLVQVDRARPTGDLDGRRAADVLYGSESFPEEANAAEARDAQMFERRDDDGQELLWRLQDRYILTRIRSGLVVVDQNAAHERIIYERALERLAGEGGLTQHLLFPHTVEFSPAKHALVEELLPDLRALGFDIEPFGGRTVIVRGVPAGLAESTAENVLEEVLDQFMSGESGPAAGRSDSLARAIARRIAVPSGRRLAVREMQALVDQLFLCETPNVCPSGRPTMLKISAEELDRRFGRASGGG